MGSPHKENINMATRMQQRRGTAAQWTAANPILAAGEIGFETDTNKFKMGNGSSTWTALQYFANAAELAAIIDGAPDLLNTLNELAAAIGDDPSFFTSIGQTISNNIDSHNVTTDVHGIDDTSLLATLENVLDAKDDAIADAATAAGEALSSHNDLSTNVHGIVDTSDLTTTSDVSGIVSTHNDETTNVHGIADTSDLTTTSDVSDIVSTHNDETTNVHGIADTSLLATTQNITDHNDETTNVHGIADTALLATEEYVDDQFTTNLGTHVADSMNVHGIADTSLLATQDYVDTAVGNSVVDQSLFAGVGIDWNVDTEEFDIDSTVATTTYVGTEIGTHNSETTSVHGIADTSLLATQSYADTAEADAITAAGTAADTKISTAVAALTKTSVGLANVDNTADADKPVSTATQTALNLKANLAGPTFTGTVTTDDLIVEGDFTVTGTTTTINATDLSITDPLIYLASNQYTEDVLDVGFLAATGAPGGTEADHLHSGFFRDASDSKKWKLISNVPHPVGNVVDITNATRETLVVGALEATTVNPSSGVVFSDGTQTKEGVPSRTPIVQKTASYALSTLTHRDSMIEVSSASATTITIPLDSTVNYPVGTTIDILQTNTGQVTIAPVSGSVTVNATPGLKLRTRWSSATLMKRAANTWVVYGDLTA
jgi:citrate lyase gamma subunit